MKHIKKKYIFEKEIKAKSFESLEFVDVKDIHNDTLKKVGKTNNIILQTTEDENIFAFIYNRNGKHIPVPLPDFTLVYYDFAYRLNVWRKDYEKEMFKKLSDITLFSELSSQDVYYFYGYSTSCIINLFTSIECFINYLIPENGEFKEVKNNRTEIYNKTQIQDCIPFMDKLKKVLPQFHDNKNFFLHSTPTNNHIIKLKELRDSIIHTKSDKTGEIAIELFKKIIKFEYDQTLLSVAKLMNFYEPNYIEDCPCGVEF